MFLTKNLRVRHRSGGRYRVLCLAHAEKTMEEVVVYQNEFDGRIWTRPVSEFTDGRFVAIPKRSETNGT